MHASYDDYTRTRSDRGPAVYLGYCGRTNRYRMMDLPDYVSNVQQGMTRWMSDASSMAQEITRGYGRPWQDATGGVRARSGRACGCDDCRCECCVCEADVLVHARCGELRRIPVTFENDTRRERPVTLQLDPFKTAGGRDLGWPAQLSASAFTLRPCDEHTVSIAVQVRCESGGGPDTSDGPAGTATNVPRTGSVDRCEVGYATLRADGCLVRPVVVAVAVLPDDCDAYRRPCGCGCCH